MKRKNKEMETGNERKMIYELTREMDETKMNEKRQLLS